MLCAKCGSVIAEENDFCTGCGVPAQSRTVPNLHNQPMRQPSPPSRHPHSQTKWKRILFSCVVLVALCLAGTVAWHARHAANRSGLKEAAASFDPEVVDWDELNRTLHPAQGSFLTGGLAAFWVAYDISVERIQKYGPPQILDDATTLKGGVTTHAYFTGGRSLKDWLLDYEKSLPSLLESWKRCSVEPARSSAECGGQIIAGVSQWEGFLALKKDYDFRIEVEKENRHLFDLNRIDWNEFARALTSQDPIRVEAFWVTNHLSFNRLIQHAPPALLQHKREGPFNSDRDWIEAMYSSWQYSPNLAQEPDACADSEPRDDCRYLLLWEKRYDQAYKNGSSVLDDVLEPISPAPCSDHLPAATSPIIPLGQTRVSLDFYTNSPQYSENAMTREGEGGAFVSLLPGGNRGSFIIGQRDLLLYFVDNQNFAFGPIRRGCSFYQEIGLTKAPSYKDPMYALLKDQDGRFIFKDYWNQFARSNRRDSTVAIVKSLCGLFPVSVYGGYGEGAPDFEDACKVF